MRIAEFVNFAYFLAFIALASIWRLPARSRAKALLIAAAGLVLTGVAVNAHRWLTSPAADIVRDWLPLPLVALAYWESACFFRTANPKLQALFERSEDAILKVLHLDVSRLEHTPLRGLFELAYILVYPVVPAGLATLYFAGFWHEADFYWSVILLSAYPCYALLLVVQLKPPRLVRESKVAHSHVRRFNLTLVHLVTHEANTFPSGHVAAAAAIALVHFRFAHTLGLVFGFIALAIAIGCVVGRYHYIVDVLAALAVAAAALLLVGAIY